MRDAYRIHLQRGRDRSVRRRHPWIFSGAIAELEATEEARPGDLGIVLTADGTELGCAMVNPAVPLVARVLRFDGGPIDGAYFRQRFRRAASLRADVIPEGTTAMRLFNAEGDGVPGLIVDRYGEFLVVQCVALGMSRLEALWLPALEEVFAPRGILDRTQKARHDANLDRRDRLLAGEDPGEPVWIEEDHIRHRVDLAAGQKTGLYLDQRENRRLIRSLARGRRVLNAFAYTGGFGTSAGLGGAREVVAVETSGAALEVAREDWAANGLDPAKLHCLREPAQEVLRRDEEPFDLIILDPPAFAKERGQVERAARAYKDVNLWAIKRLGPGAYLATFSCSHHIDLVLFQKILFGASIDARRPLQWISRLGAGPDHPVHLDHPQGEYLKGFLLRAME